MADSWEKAKLDKQKAEAAQRGVNKPPEWASKAWAAVKGTVMPKSKADSNDKKYK